MTAVLVVVTTCWRVNPSQSWKYPSCLSQFTNILERCGETYLAQEVFRNGGKFLMSFVFLLSKSETKNLSHGSVLQFKELPHAANAQAVPLTHLVTNYQVLHLWPNLDNSPSWIASHHKWMVYEQTSIGLVEL